MLQHRAYYGAWKSRSRSRNYIYVYNFVLFSFLFFEKYLLRQLESATIGLTQKNERHKDWYVVVKTKTKDVFDVGTSLQCNNDDVDTFCENIPYNISTNNVRDDVNDNLGWALDDVEDMTINVSIISDRDVHEPQLNKNEFIDNESNNEEYDEYEYINDE